jgi:hypothetical protein
LVENILQKSRGNKDVFIGTKNNYPPKNIIMDG